MWTVNTLGVVGEGFGWSVELVLEEYGARTFDDYARKRNTLALDCPIRLYIMDDLRL